MPTPEPIPALDGPVLSVFGRLRRIFSRAVRALRRGGLPGIRHVLAKPDPVPSSDAGWDRLERDRLRLVTSAPAWSAFRSGVRQIYQEEGPISSMMLEAAAASVSPVVGAGALDADLLREVAASWMEKAGADLVTAVDTSTRGGLRMIIRDGLRGSVEAREIARRIYRLEGFGLSTTGEAQLGKYARTLHRQWVEGEISLATMEDRIRRRRDRLTLERADLVVGHEARTAGNEAHLHGARLAVDEGLLDPEEWVWVWVTRLSGFCPRCDALRGAVSEIPSGGVFTSRSVTSGKWKGQVIVLERAPVHVRCNCGKRLEQRKAVDLPMAA